MGNVNQKTTTDTHKHKQDCACHGQRGLQMLLFLTANTFYLQKVQKLFLKGKKVKVTSYSISQN